MATIRRYRKGDEPGIQSAIKEVYDEYGFLWDPEGYHKDIYSMEEHFRPPHAFWVAENAVGVIVATGGVEIFPPIPGPVGELVQCGKNLRVGGADCELVRLYVRPSAREGGIGTQLCEAIIEYAKSEKCRLMEIWSDTQFSAAHRLYKRLGAHVLGMRSCTYPEEYDEFGMSLNLES
ncbi:GNAT family N-acetyltransferase [Kamptonema cortianum]|nr:GNAT family N-acetyltransferase [Geitlerinema splendidum]MDK3158576.1 GNAT family N-acetyltransferase [Kamptonema cortianum]